MSRHLVERVLHQLTIDRSAKQSFKEDAAAYLERFALSEDERRMLAQFDVKGLQDAGVNPMLTMGYWQELSPERGMRGYMQRLRPVADGQAIHVASLKQ